MIDERAVIDPSAKIADDVTIGPYSIVGPDVEIGAGCEIGPHVVLKGPTKLGKNNKIFQFSSIGEIPQDLKFHGEDVYLDVGDNNVFREFCTINRGTENGGSYTKIGNNNLFMAYVHVAHDCIIHNHTIFSNNASLAGHVIVEDHVILGGFAGVAQFCNVGRHSFICTNSVVNKDVLPYSLVSGYYAKPFGLNSVGLRRRGFSDEVLSALQKAYKIIYRQGLTAEAAIEALKADYAAVDEVMNMVAMMEQSKAGIVR